VLKAVAAFARKNRADSEQDSQSDQSKQVDSNFNLLML